MNEEDLLLIDRASRGELTPEEQTEFARRLEQDGSFKALHDEVQVMIQAVKSVAFERLAKEADSKSDRGNVIAWPVPRVLAIAATVTLAVVAGIWLYNSQASDLAEQYYSSYTELEIATPRGGLQLYDLKVRAYERYKAHAIPAASVLLDSALAFDPADGEALLLTGLCRLETSSYQEALAAFEAIPDSQPTRAIADWYSALAYIGLKEYKKASAILTTVEQSSGHPFASKAAELRKKLPGN